jgi:hypothetical protein
VDQLLEHLVGAGVDEVVRDVDRGVGDRRVDDRLAELVLDALAVGLLEPRPDVGLQLVERVEAGGV